MTKKELTQNVAEAANISNASAAKAVDAVVANIKNEVSKGGTVALRGFGSFKTKSVQPKKVRNFQTGESYMTPAKKVVKFVVSEEFSNSLN